MQNRILIDSQAFAAKRETLHGSVSLNELDKRIWSPDIADATELHYTVHGGVDRWQRPFLDVSISGNLSLYCQRCMQPMPFVLNEQAHLILFATEAELDKAMLADDETEGILISPELDLYTLLEDQIVMALPIAPTHDDCDNATLKQVNQNKPNPFAVLAGLQKG